MSHNALRINFELLLCVSEREREREREKYIERGEGYYSTCEREKYIERGA
jgi:hypothetical protein